MPLEECFRRGENCLEPLGFLSVECTRHKREPRIAREEVPMPVDETPVQAIDGIAPVARTVVTHLSQVV